MLVVDFSTGAHFASPSCAAGHACALRLHTLCHVPEAYALWGSPQSPCVRILQDLQGLQAMYQVESCLKILLMEAALCPALDLTPTTQSSLALVYAAPSHLCALPWLCRDLDTGLNPQCLKRNGDLAGAGLS